MRRKNREWFQQDIGGLVEAFGEGATHFLIIKKKTEGEADYLVNGLAVSQATDWRTLFEEQTRAHYVHARAYTPPTPINNSIMGRGAARGSNENILSDTIDEAQRRLKTYEPPFVIGQGGILRATRKLDRLKYSRRPAAHQANP